MVPRTRCQGRHRWWFLLALGVLALVCGGVPLLTQAAAGGATKDAGVIPVERSARAGPDGLTFRVAPAAPASSNDPAAPAARSTSVGRAAALGSPPVRLKLSRLAIDAPVLPVSVGGDGLLDVPENPSELGWWSDSARPGMPSGSVGSVGSVGSIVIDGHVDSATLGLGALFRLHEARPGDQVLVTNEARVSTRYTVVARRSYPKASLPVAEVFARDVGPRLVLLTCGGRFDPTTRRYADNIVVYAVPR